jgi:hypothetical protein
MCVISKCVLPAQGSNPVRFLGTTSMMRSLPGFGRIQEACKKWDQLYWTEENYLMTFST